MGVCRLNSNFLKAWKNDERSSKFSVTSVSVSKESETIIYVALGTGEVWKCPYKVTSARCFPQADTTVSHVEKRFSGNNIPAYINSRGFRSWRLDSPRHCSDGTVA